MAITRELMLSEVAKVIDGRPALGRKALIKCGVRLSARPGKRELVSAVAVNLVSKCVRVAIMKLVLANQLPFIDGADRAYGDLGEKVGDFDTDLSRDEFMNHPGFISGLFGGGGGGSSTTTTTPTQTTTTNTSSGGNKGISGGEALGAGVQVLSTIAGIWQGNKGYKEMGKQRAHEMQLAQMNRDLMLEQMNLSANQPVSGPTQAGMGGGANMTTFVLLGIGVVAIIGFGIYSAMKGRGRVKSSAPVTAAN